MFTRADRICVSWTVIDKLGGKTIKYLKDKRGIFAISEKKFNGLQDRKYITKSCKEVNPILFYVLYILKHVLYIPLLLCLLLVAMGSVGEWCSNRLDTWFHKIEILR